MKRRLRRFWRRHKESILYATLIAPVFVGFIFFDIMVRHPRVGVAYFLGAVVWDGLFAIANGKSLRRGTPKSHTRKDATMTKRIPFVEYHITSGGEGQEERSIS